MSKNQPDHAARDRFGFWNFFHCTNAKRSLLLEYNPMVGVAGFEPATLRLSSACSNQLSYTPISRETLVEAWGFEPQTYSLQSYRSTN
jgi:hypothetical protein